MKGGKNFFILVAALFVISFFIFNNVFSANSDIIINEIGAYATNTHEWIELWNKGTTTVDLAGWKLWEGGVRHVCSASSTDSLMSPGEYAVLVQDEVQFKKDHLGFGGSIFDSSWGSLSEGGEEIGLEDTMGTSTEKFTYSAIKNFSLERKNPFLNDYGPLNWQEHVTGNTVGLLNSNFSTSTATSTPNNPTSTADNIFLWSQLRINEIVPNPETGEEWVEIFNPTTTSIKLEGGTLCDNRDTASCTIATPTTTILAQGWAIVSIQGNKLNNNGDSVILKNPSSTFVDQVVYGGTLIPKEGQALARSQDGAGEWVITTTLTPGATNTITSPPIPPSTSGGIGSGGVQNASPEEVLKYLSYSPLIINEIYPDPPGPDTDQEFVELKNISLSTIQLAGWKLRNTSKIHTLNGELQPNDFLVIPRSTSGIALKNSGEEIVRVINNTGEVVDEIRYTDASEKESYNLTLSHMWQWSKEITPGEENKIVTSSQTGDDKKEEDVSEVGQKSENFIWNLEVPMYATVGESVTFSAVGSADARGGESKYTWKIGNEAILSGEKVPYIFSTSGLFIVAVGVSTTAGTNAYKEFQIPVGLDGIGGPSDIVISEVFPTPNEEGQEEFIELFNEGTERIEVSGWKIKVDKEKTLTIPTSTFMAPGAYLVFYKPVTKLVFNNKQFLVELFNKKGGKVDELNISHPEAGKSYSLIRDNWYWDVPNPHKALFFPSVISTTEPLVVPTKTKESFVATKTPKSVTKKTITTRKERLSKVQGIVTVAPGTFSSQYFYIGTPEGGIQIYQNKKDFPDLEVGDKVVVQGKFSTLKNVKRLIIQDQNAIDILDTEQIIEPTQLKISELTKALPGALVKVAGEITELKTTNMYIDDGEEVVVSFKKGTNIDKKKFIEGNKIEVVGILEHAAKGVQILPRSQEDVVETNNKEIAENIESPTKNEGLKKYVNVTIGGITAGALGWLARARGLVMVGALRGVGKKALALFRRNKSNS